jgi:hypothetical protein
MADQDGGLLGKADLRLVSSQVAPPGNLTERAHIFGRLSARIAADPMFLALLGLDIKDLALPMPRRSRF